MADSDNESGGHNASESSPREQDRLLPIANVSRIMKKALPANAKISKDAKETVQECVSEFISFITGEASDKCQREKRKTINGDDLLWAMTTLGFEEYVEPLKIYLQRFRDMEGEKSAMAGRGEKEGGGGGGGNGSVVNMGNTGGAYLGEGEDFDGRRNVVEEEGDATGRKYYVKEPKIKKNVANNAEGTRPRKYGEVGDVGGCERFEADKNVVVEKADKKKKKSRKKQGARDQGKGTSGDAKPGKQKKNVRFSDHVEVFQLSNHEEKLVRGKRFSREEDEIVMRAVHDYIDAHNLGDEGLSMVLNCRSHPEVRNCWKEIAMAIPYRPREAVYFRAQNLFRRSETTKWTEKEFKIIKEYQEKHGNQWKPLAEELHKHRVHVKDTWRRIKLSNRKKGHWSQEEYQRLFDLVNLDMKLRLKEEKKSKHGMLRDNISFEAISDTLSTRSFSTCCNKWYKQLTSSMVMEGQWVDSDDYRLIIALYELDAICIEDVDWDSLLEHRPGDLCRKRWNQMALHIGYHGTRSFAEQVDVLGKCYCPDQMEVREEWDIKPVVDV